MLERISPNVWTTLRLALIIPIMILLSFHTATTLIWCVALMIVGAFTDYMDGNSARKYGKVTKFGTYYDPMADALYHDGIFLVLLSFGLWLPVVAIFIARDIVAMSVKAFAATENKVISASRSAKLKFVAIEVFTFSTVLMLLCNSLGNSFSLAVAPLLLIAAVSCIAAVSLTLVSMFGYIRQAWPHIAKAF